MVKQNKEEIFRARAETLAAGGKQQEYKQGAIETVLFSIAKERYAIESIYIREAYSLKELTKLPCVPPFVVGVIQVRRKIYSVIDLRKLFDLRIQESAAKALILEKEKMAFGILVEEVLGMKDVYPSELQQPLPSMTGILLEFVKGITKDKIVVLNGSAILNSSSLIVEQLN